MDSNKKKLILAGSIAAVAVALLAWHFLGGGGTSKAGSVIEGSKNPPPKEGQDAASEGTGGGRGMSGPTGPSTSKGG
ncbi:MAG: hypothetical protein IT439_03020 [Phycisphaerales bacterium]|nr:hypothetical protein [Phycisphaerales bacterium]